MKLGIDCSSYFEELEAGAAYFIDGKKVDPLLEFAKNGVSLFRIRIWNDPFDENGKPYLGGTVDAKRALELAKLGKKYGFEIVYDFHYSDFWADPGRQLCPKAWRGLSYEEVQKRLYQFTYDTLNLAKEAGVEISYAQIGNEITNGTCFPYGQLHPESAYGEDPEKVEAPNYDGLAGLLKQGISAAKAVFPSLKAIIHLERSYDQATYREYFDALEERNVPYDIIGMSYYPFWHGTIEEFYANVDMLKARYGKPVMNMELGYPFTTEDYLLDEEGKAPQLVINGRSDLVKNLPFPVTEEGQRDFVALFLKLAKEHGLAAVNYWEPCWIPGVNKEVSWASKEGQKYAGEDKDTRIDWANQALFDYRGNATPAFHAFKKE